jgi:hypothetical protein
MNRLHLSSLIAYSSPPAAGRLWKRSVFVVGLERKEVGGMVLTVFESAV